MELAELNWAAGCKRGGETAWELREEPKDSQTRQVSMMVRMGEMSGSSYARKGEKEEPQDAVGWESWTVFQV